MNRNLPKLQPGDLVAGRFRIIEPIGSGGFSVVYRAHQEDMNRFIALKVLKPQASNDEKIVERFRREALYASHLSHPNTIVLYDYGHTDDNLCYIAMEYLHGMDLSAVVQTHKPMDLKRVWRIIAECSRSLSEAHKLGLVHRDLKPENIFLVQSDNGDQEFVKVLDFGVSKAISSFGDAPSTLAPLTQEGTVFGTPLYMAPEQAMAESISPAVDVYALGHIMFEMITGYAAYEGTTNAMDVMLKQINDPPLALPEPWDNTPFSELITLCTQKDPEHRISNASLLMENLLNNSFLPWSDKVHQPIRTLTAPKIAAVEVVTEHISYDMIEEVFSSELEILNLAFKEVLENKPRLVLIKGQPGVGRSNILRGFVDQRTRFKPHARVLHRSFENGMTMRGIEYELALLTGETLQGNGIKEVRRILHNLYGEASDFEEDDLDSDSKPMGALSAFRDSLFSKIGKPFHDNAKERPVIWALENLERLDTLTLAFLDRFFRDIKHHQLPILIVATVFPEALQRRRGVAKYTDSILKEDPFTRSISVSYVPATIEDEDPPTLRLETPFEDMRTEKMEALQDESPFDKILGHLAQLGDEIPLDLWKLTHARILETKLIGAVDATLQQAEKFGIISLVNDVICFSQRGYAETLRDSFEKLGGSQTSHLKIAELLEQFYENPTHEQIARIASQWNLGGRSDTAVAKLVSAGDKAYRALDFDASREYFLQVQQIFSRFPERFESGYDHSQIWLRLGEVHWALNEHGASEDALQRAIAYSNHNDMHTLAHANKLLGDLSQTQGKYVDALKFYEKARDGFEQTGLGAAYTSATNEMAKCALSQNKTGLAEDLCRQALKLAEQLGEDFLIGRVNRNLGLVLARRARFAESIQHLDDGLVKFESLGKTDELVEILNEIGYAAYAEGDYDRSIGYFRHAMNLSNNGHASQVGAAKVLLARENFDEAEKLLNNVLVRSSSVNDVTKMSEAYFLLGDIKLALKQSENALHYYHHAIELGQTIGQFRLVISVRIRLAYTYFLRSEDANIFDALSKGMDVAKKMGNVDDEMQIRAHLIYIQLLLYGFKDRDDTFTILLEESVAANLPRATTLCYVFKADAEAARGLWTSASHYLRHARNYAAQFEDYGSFLQIRRRQALVQCKTEIDLTAQDCITKGYSMGGLIPPEVGLRRFRAFPEVT